MADREEGATAPESVEPGATGGDDVAAVRREAAGYRVRLRDAEQERDALAGRLERMQRAEAERLAAQAPDDGPALADGADLWRGDGVELAGLLDDEGNVDPGRVREAVEQIGAAHEHWLARRAPASVDQGRGVAVEPDERPSFGGALKGAGADA
jgi:hypothetical protein